MYICVYLQTGTQVEFTDNHHIGDSGLHELVWGRNHLSSLATCIALNLELKAVGSPLKHNLANESSRFA